MNIGIDLDGTLVNTYPRLLEQLNEEFNISMRYEDCLTYELVKNYHGLSEELTRDVFNRMIFILRNNQNFYKELPLMNEKDIDWIKETQEQGNNVFYITKRNEHLRLATYEWLEKYGLEINNVHFECDKPKVCRKLGIDFYLEDAPIEYINLRVEGINTFLINQPYNRDMLTTTSA